MKIFFKLSNNIYNYAGCENQTVYSIHSANADNKYIRNDVKIIHVQNMIVEKTIQEITYRLYAYHM